MSEKLRSKLRIVGSHWLGGTKVFRSIAHVRWDLDVVGENFY